MNKLMTAILFAVVSAIVLAGCGGHRSDEVLIEDTVESFYRAFNAEDWGTCLSYIDDTDNLGSSTIESELKETRAATGRVTVLFVTNISVDGSTAKADVTLTFAGASIVEPATTEFPFVKVEGRWRLSWDV